MKRLSNKWSLCFSSSKVIWKAIFIFTSLSLKANSGSPPGFFSLERQVLASLATFSSCLCKKMYKLFSWHLYGRRTPSVFPLCRPKEHFISKGLYRAKCNCSSFKKKLMGRLYIPVPGTRYAPWQKRLSKSILSFLELRTK